MEADEFLSNGNRIFRNSVTAWYINKELYNITDSNENLVSNLGKLNSRLYKKWNELVVWKHEHWRSNYPNNEFMQSCYEVGIEKNLLRTDLLEDLQEIKKWFTQDLLIFDLLDKKAFKDEDHLKDIIVLLKHKKKRLSPEFYNPGPNLFEIARRALEKPKRLLLPKESSYKLSSYYIVEEGKKALSYTTEVRLTMEEVEKELEVPFPDLIEEMLNL